MLGQWDNIFEPFAKRRQLADATGYSIIKIGAKLAAANKPQKIPVGCANQPECRSLPRIAAYTFVGSLLDYP